MSNVLHLTSMYPLCPEGIHSGGHAVYHLVESLRREMGEHSQTVELYHAYCARYYGLLSRRKRDNVALRQTPWLPYLRFRGFLDLPYGWLSDSLNPMWQRLAGQRTHRRIDADLLHVHTPFDLSYYSLRLATRYDRPLVITVRREMSRWPTIRRQRQNMLREPLLRANAIIAPSQCLADRVAEVSGRTPTVVPNGTDQLFDSPPPTRNQRITNRVLFVGTLNENKAASLLIRAVRHLRRTGDDVECRIAGSGVMEGELRRLADGCDRIAFLGNIGQEAVRDEMRAAQILCVPSRSETFGIVYGEAMKQGAVVVGRKGTGIDGMGKDGVHYELIRSDEDLLPTLSRLLRDPDRCDRMRNEAAKLAEKWTWEESARTHAAIYRSVLEEHATRAAARKGAMS